MEFVVSIRNKIAEYAGDAIYVCGNADCKIVFDFDIAWDGIGVKTARFVKDDGTYQEQVFTGNECPVPVISDTYGIRVGVYAGNLHTFFNGIPHRADAFNHKQSVFVASS